MTRTALFLYILLGCILIVVVACSNTGTIEGHVIDRLTKKPIEAATVTVEGTLLSATTNPRGYYKIKGVIPGQQTISAGKKGFDSSDKIKLAIAKGTISKPVSLEIQCVSESCAHIYEVGATGWFADFVSGELLSGVELTTSNNQALTDEIGTFELTN